MWLWLILRLASAGSFDRVIAVVDDTVITASDERFEMEIDGLDGSDFPFWSSRTAHQRLIDTGVIRILAGDIQVYQPEDTEVEERIELLRSKVLDNEVWQQYLARGGLDETGLRAWMRRRLIVERYLRRNIILPLDSPEWFVQCEALLERARGNAQIRIIHEHG